MLKNQIRKRILKIRKNKNSNLFEIDKNKLLKIIKRIKNKKKIIGCYYPVNSEINTKKIMKFLEKKRFIICLPVIKNNIDMEFYEYKSEEPLYVNKYGIPEPINKRKIKPNILLIPIVAFDRKLNRLGYGGGFYDRFLKKMEKHKLLKIGLAFSYQRIKNIPIEKFDKKLDYVLTEKEIFA